MRLFEQITDDIACLKTRCESYRDETILADLKDRIKELAAWRQRVLAKIVKALRAENDLKQRLDLLLSIPGLGERTAVQLLINMPELGRITREEAASLAGMAPFDHASGQSDGRRHIAGGRAEVRTALYAASLPASYRWNPALVAMRERMSLAGKPFKLVMVACARKLLIFANTVLARQTPGRIAGRRARDRLARDRLARHRWPPPPDGASGCRRPGRTMQAHTTDGSISPAPGVDWGGVWQGAALSTRLPTEALRLQTMRSNAKNANLMVAQDKVVGRIDPAVSVFLKDDPVQTGSQDEVEGGRG